MLCYSRLLCFYRSQDILFLMHIYVMTSNLQVVHNMIPDRLIGEKNPKAHHQLVIGMMISFSPHESLLPRRIRSKIYSVLINELFRRQNIFVGTYSVCAWYRGTSACSCLMWMKVYNADINSRAIWLPISSGKAVQRIVLTVLQNQKYIMIIRRYDSYSCYR